MTKMEIFQNYENSIDLYGKKICCLGDNYFPIHMSQMYYFMTLIHIFNYLFHYFFIWLRSYTIFKNFTLI